eukprot:gene11618-14226_t
MESTSTTDSNNNSTSSSTTSTNINKTASLSDLSLFRAFTIGQKLYLELEESDLSSNDPDYQSKLKSAISHLVVSSIKIDRESIFSKNEDLDDIRTDSLKYVLTPYYLSELYTKLSDVDRIKNLKNSKNKLLQFLHQCEQLSLVDKEDLVIISREGKTDPTSRRNELISRGKRDKENREKLKYMTNKRMELLNKDNKNDEEIDEEGCGDEEVERNFILHLIKESIFKGIASLETIEIELPMLIEIEAIKDKNNGMVPPPPQPKSSGIGNFQILPDGRRVALDRVFRPSHILPTMTPEEAAMWEMQNGGMVSGKGGPESGKKESDDEEDDDDDEKLKKKRDWDDWKDDNPKGWGNSKR